MPEIACDPIEESAYSEAGWAEIQRWATTHDVNVTERESQLARLRAENRGLREQNARLLAEVGEMREELHRVRNRLAAAELEAVARVMRARAEAEPAEGHR